MDRPPAENTHGSFRTRLSADGAPGPIEERCGRRLLRTVPPESDEGRSLLGEERVELFAPGGESLGHDPDVALDILRRKLEARLAEPDEDAELAALQDGLDRLRRRNLRFGNA